MAKSLTHLNVKVHIFGCWLAGFGKYEVSVSSVRDEGVRVRPPGTE